MDEAEYHPVLVILTSAMVLGIPLNVMVIAVRGIKYFYKRKISSYQFIITQIAVSDLIFAILIAFDIDSVIQGTWRFSFGLCALLRPIKSITAAVPGFFMFILAFERFQGVKHTLKQKLTLTKTVVISIMAWIVAILSFVPFATFIRVDSHTVKATNQTVSACHVVNDYPSVLFNNIYHGYATIIFLVVPFVLTTFFHFRIYNFVKSHAKKMSVHRQNTGNKNIGVGSSTVGESESSDHKISTDDPDLGAGIDFERFQCDTIEEVDDDVFIPHEKETRINNIKERFKAIFHNSTIRQRFLTRRNRPKVRKLKIHILFAISICFFVCIFPNYLWHYMVKLNLARPGNSAWDSIQRVFGSFIYLHCFVNGIIYSIMDKKFRTDAWLVIKCIITLKPYHLQEQALLKARMSRASFQTTSMS